MKVIELYENWGILGHEKTPIYSTAHGEIYNRVKLEIPDTVKVTQSVSGEILVTLPGSEHCYFLHEVLTTCKGVPSFAWIDDNLRERYMRLRKAHEVQEVQDAYEVQEDIYHLP